jgi:uncharacterized protein YutE (UPF0331/DUF86 family)
MVPSGIDKERIFSQMSQLEDHLARLNEIKDALAVKPHDRIVSAAAERLLQLSIEDCLNIANHIVAGLALVKADTYRELFVRLKDEKLLTEKTGSAMMSFASFRNRLVHLYWNINEGEIIDKLNEVSFFRDFAEEINAYMIKNKHR